MPKSFTKLALFSCAAVYSLYAALLVPAYEYIGCDIMLANTLWFDAVDILLQWTEFAGAALVMATLTVALYHGGALKPCQSLFMKLGGILVLKYLVSVIALSVVHGSAFDTTLDFGGYVLSLAIELAVFTLVAYLTWRYVTNKNATEKAQAKAAATLKTDAVAPENALPLPSPFRRSPLLRILLIGVSVYTAIRAAAYLLNELAFILMGFSFTAGDVPVTLLYFLLLVLLPGFLCYLLSYLFTNLLHRQYKK